MSNQGSLFGGGDGNNFPPINNNSNTGSLGPGDINFNVPLVLTDSQNTLLERGNSGTFPPPGFWTDNGNNLSFGFSSNSQEVKNELINQQMMFFPDVSGGSQEGLQNPPNLRFSAFLAKPDDLSVIPEGKEEVPFVEPENPEISDILPRLEEIKKMYLSQEQSKQELMRKQAIVTARDKNEFTALQQQLFKLSQSIAAEIKEMTEIFRNSVLNLEESLLWIYMNNCFQSQQQHVETLRTELQNLANDDNRSLLCLTYLDQPYAHIVFKSRTLDPPYSLRILSGAKTRLEFLHISDVRAAPYSGDTPTGTGNSALKTPISLEHANAKPEIQQGVVTFGDLKISVSTRMNPIQLQFHCTITEGGPTTKKSIIPSPNNNSNNVPVTIYSKPSYPLIVITNESQWGEAAGKLLLNEVFGELPSGASKKGFTSEALWPYFINTLQRHLLRATGQEGGSNNNNNNTTIGNVNNNNNNNNLPTSRGLSKWEAENLQVSYFGGKDIISKDAALTFWNWFGQVLTSIKFKRHIRAMWISGFIYGVISKQECQRILADRPVGSFLIRFSESTPGSFAIAYVAHSSGQNFGFALGNRNTNEIQGNTIVKHYLVKTEDIGANKSLPDFIKDKQYLKMICILDPKKRRVEFCDKDTALSMFYTKRKGPEPTTQGYEQNLDSEH